MKSGLMASPSSASSRPPSEHSRGASIPPALRALPSVDLPFRVLIVEGEAPQDTLLADVVHAELPEADIVRTPGALGALALSHIHAFHLLVVDSPLGAELQIELLEAFMDQNPKAEVILTAAEFATPGNRGPKIHVLAQPVNPLELLSQVRECRERAMSPDSEASIVEEEENHFVVVLNRHTPIEVVQFKCLSGATTALDFIRRNGPGGRIWFERGEICHAETAGLTGEKALVEMITWPGGSIVEVVAPPPLEKTIDMPWQSLLMQAAHAADEQRAQTVTIV